MALILNIETATDIGSICISKGKDVLTFREGTNTFSHAKETTMMIEACLKEAKITMNDIEAIAISKGPGSYTSLRIGTSTAKGICYALDKPLIAVDTLQSMALAASKLVKGDIYAPMIDARRMEVYTAFYATDLNCLKEVHALIFEEDIFAAEIIAQKQIIFAGNGCEKIKHIKNSEQFVFTDIRCHALHLVPLSYEAFQKNQFESLAYFEPTYLKPPNITIPKKRL